MSLEWLPGDKATKPCFSFTVLHFVFISCEFYFRNQNNTNNNNLKNFSSAISTLSISLLVYHKPVLYASGNTESVYELSTVFFNVNKNGLKLCPQNKIGKFFPGFSQSWICNSEILMNWVLHVQWLCKQFGTNM